MARTGVVSGYGHLSLSLLLVTGLSKRLCPAEPIPAFKIGSGKVWHEGSGEESEAQSS